ncbi:enoyl-CoA hydratase/isomerase family protein [Sinirhodobacter huangdaonensis]|uniref:Enoyl-CoA hydratase/isomerase family protein n=1 Tax=Paenirhodobacter huangdaonensis TaxID=2501515 RepID=A0A3S3PFP6_9RHOB|nr:enoyl-CoA hydratase/isomerase family protein [Sinirhodobacter huangdaonensis]RWR52071.1 enoyl-CoA hydratase/isomerase family protein [Sinirhodobacter huangdaonensis]
MTRRARLQRREGVALITLAGAAEAPAGAGFDAGLRAALAGALAACDQDPELRAIVLRAGDGGWPVAAEAAEDYAETAGVPTLGVLANRIATARVPVVAVLTGTIAGGGLALAQASGLRMALSGTRFAAPEAGIGLIPAAGGLVRLARRAGAAAALDFVTAGRGLDAQAAMRAGLCDAVASEGAVESAALTEALRVADSGAAPLPPREGSVEDPVRYLDGLEAARARLPEGPLAAVFARAAEVIEAAALLPLSEALEFEAVAYADLAGAELSAALRHVAAARRAAAQIAGAPVVGEVARVGSVALWNQPDRLALALLGRGLRVQLGATDPARIEASVRLIAEAQEAALQAGRVNAAKRDADWDRLEPVAAPEAFGPADVMLAAPGAGELARLRAALPAGTLVALEGGGAGAELSFVRWPGLTEIWAAAPEPGAALHRLAAVLRAEGGAVVHARGLGGQLEAAFLAAAERAVMAGAAPAAVDAALTGWGFAEGPFARLDRIGLVAGQGLLAAAGRSGGAYLAWLGLEGRTGRAAGRGVWLYEAGKPPAPWPDEAPVLEALRVEAGVAVRRLGAAEIVARVLAEIAGAGAAALQAGAAHRAGDVDLAAIAATGFPRHRGGPLFQADRTGLLALRKRLRALVDEGAPEPVTLLDVLIRNGRRFGELDG